MPLFTIRSIKVPTPPLCADPSAPKKFLTTSRSFSSNCSKISLNLSGLSLICFKNFLAANKFSAGILLSDIRCASWRAVAVSPPNCSDVFFKPCIYLITTEAEAFIFCASFTVKSLLISVSFRSACWGSTFVISIFRTPPTLCFWPCIRTSEDANSLLVALAIAITKPLLLKSLKYSPNACLNSESGFSIISKTVFTISLAPFWDLFDLYSFIIFLIGVIKVFTLLCLILLSSNSSKDIWSFAGSLNKESGSKALAHLLFWTFISPDSIGRISLFWLGTKNLDAWKYPFLSLSALSLLGTA